MRDEPAYWKLILSAMAVCILGAVGFVCLFAPLHGSDVWGQIFWRGLGGGLLFALDAALIWIWLGERL